MVPAKIISLKYCWIANVGQPIVGLDGGRDRVNPVCRNLIVREWVPSLRIGNRCKSTEVAVPHRLRRNRGDVKGAQWYQLLIPGSVEKRMVPPDGTRQFSLPIMLNVWGPCGIGVRGSVQATIEMLVVDHAMEVFPASLGGQVVRDDTRAVCRRVDGRYRCFVKEF